MRKQFILPAEDIEWLDTQGLQYELVIEAGVLRVVIYEMSVPDGYNVAKVDVIVRIDAGYPDTQIDMAYFSPALIKANGALPGSVSEDVFEGKPWQRWSRHRTAINPWRPGIDNLGTHFGLVQDWLEKELIKGQPQ